MKNIFKKNAAIAALLLALSVSLSAQSKEPTASAASGGGTQTVNAVQSGPWAVGIDPAKNTVRVANTAADPIQVDIVNTKSREPYQVKMSIPILGNGPNSSTETYVNLPAGKRFIIEAIFAEASIPPGTRAGLSILTYFDSTSVSWNRQYIPLTEIGTFGTNTTHSGNLKTLMYGATRITLAAQPNWSGANGGAMVILSGQLEDLPAVQ